MVYVKMIILGLALFMVPIAHAMTIEPIPEITIVYDTQNLNIASPHDDNIFKVFCDDVGSVCNVYRTDGRHTTLTGD